jgi:hypothetical protein
VGGAADGGKVIAGHVFIPTQSKREAVCLRVRVRVGVLLVCKLCPSSVQ